MEQVTNAVKGAGRWLTTFSLDMSHSQFFIKSWVWIFILSAAYAGVKTIISIL